MREGGWFGGECMDIGKLESIDLVLGEKGDIGL